MSLHMTCTYCILSGAPAKLSLWLPKVFRQEPQHDATTTPQNQAFNRKGMRAILEVNSPNPARLAAEGRTLAILEGWSVGALQRRGYRSLAQQPGPPVNQRSRPGIVKMAGYIQLGETLARAYSCFGSSKLNALTRPNQRRALRILKALCGLKGELDSEIHAAFCAQNSAQHALLCRVAYQSKALSDEEKSGLLKILERAQSEVRQ